MGYRKALCLVILPAFIYITFFVPKDNDNSLQKPAMTFKWKSKVLIPGRLHPTASDSMIRPKSNLRPKATNNETYKSLVLEKLKRGMIGDNHNTQPSLHPQGLLDSWKKNHLEIAEALHHLIGLKITFDDSRLLDLIRRSTVAPSDGKLKTTRGFRMTPLEGAVDRLLRAKKGGFFLEANAFDGEESSQTLWLERVRGWTGVLMEPDCGYFLQLIGKNRRVWAMNAALSSSMNPSLVIMADAERQLGIFGHEATGGNKKLFPAFPIASILGSLNQRRFDFLRLDLREEEWSELDGIPWGKVQPAIVAIQVRGSAEFAEGFAERLTHHRYLCHPARHEEDRIEPRTSGHILCMFYDDEDENEINDDYKNEFSRLRQ